MTQPDSENSFKNLIFDRYLKVLQKTEWMPRNQLQAYQQHLLTRIVQHAYDNVPFYRDRLACLYTTAGAIDVSRWHEVPVLSRDDVPRHADSMRAPRLADLYGAVHETRTSGSTGTPLTITFNALVRIASNAAFTRMAGWWDVDTEQPLARISFPHARNPAPYPEGHDWQGWSFTSPAARAYDLDVVTPTEQQVEFLRRKKVRYLTTLPSNAAALAYAVQPEQGRELGIELIFGIGETVLPRAREIVTERLNARIAAIYSCEEIGFIATQCSTNPCYHTVVENAVVEILRSDGSPAAPGETGQVVVTGLHNYAMPFIRYAIGDVATLGLETCPCGRTLPLLEQVEGRTRHAFVFKDGTRIWPRIRTLREMGNFVHHRECQVAQIDYETIDVRYVPDGSGRAPDLAGLDRYVREKFHPSVRATATAMPAIPRGRSGKFHPIISMVGD